MVNYKSITEFFEEVVLTEGRTDVQAHVGFMKINNATAQELAENAFGGQLALAPYLGISEFEKIIYVYLDDDYLMYAGDNFSWADKHHFQVYDSEGQRIACWAIGA